MKTVSVVVAVLALLLMAMAPAVASAAGSISGTVTTASDGEPFEDAEVCAEATGEGDFGCATTDAGGEYTISNLSAGSYKVEFWTPSALNYVIQFFDAKLSWKAADPVAVTDALDTPNVNAALEKGGQIKGRAIDAVSKAGIQGIWVCAGPIDEEGSSRCGLTDATGAYTISGLATDSYEVAFYPEEGEAIGYLTQYYDGKASWFEATPVPVAGAVSSGIDAEMKKAGRIAGTVTDAASGAGIRSAIVCAIDVALLEIANCAEAGSNGHYEIGGLPSGAYKVWFSPDVPAWEEEDDYFQQYWNAKPTLAQATPIALGASSLASGVDARLASRRAAPAPTVVPAPQRPLVVRASSPRPRVMKCRKGWKKVRAKGKTRCVRIHHKHHRHH
jgi:hypothetical protein